MTNKLASLFLIVFIAALAGSTGLAHPHPDDEPLDPKELPWDRADIELGVFFTVLNSNFTLGSESLGIGASLDVEKFLGLDQNDRAFRLDGGFRLTRNYRHAIEFSWFQLNRDGTNLAPDDIELPGDPDIPEGALISSVFDFDIIKAKYLYSFLLNESFDLNVGGGLYVMPIRFGVGLSGEPKVEEQITAPLPVISFGFSAALSRKQFLRQNVDFLYLSLSGYTGSILDLNIKVERNLSKRIGLGLGFELLDIELTSQEEGRIPGQDFVGQVGFGYTGLQLYIRGRFP